MTFDPRTEKNLATLTPRTQAAARRLMAVLVVDMAKHGVQVRIISGTRTYAEQDALYAQGRTAPGRKVTNARAGFSNHNFGVAFDIGLFRGADYLEDSPLYKECGVIGRNLGELEWGGDWTSFRDEPHFQLHNGLSLATMRNLIAAGKTID